MDPASPASRTALATARFRAAHQLLDRGEVLADPLAIRIVGEPEDDLRGLDLDRRLRIFVCARAGWWPAARRARRLSRGCSGWSAPPAG